jgi:hypothetical protein
MGTNSLGYLLILLNQTQAPNLFRREIEYLVEKQSLVRVALPPIPDRHWQAVEAFRVLGPVAKPAIPKLAELLRREPPYDYTFGALQAIGPDSVPVLMQAMSSAKHDVRLIALQTLGELGTAAQAASPTIAKIAASANDFLRKEAIQVLSEVDPNPGRFNAFFSETLNDTNLAMAAAFALGRIGPEGVLPLIHALTNQNRQTRFACISALAPEMRSLRRENGPEDYSFRGIICLYNSKMLSIAWRMYQEKPEADLVVPAVSSWLDHPSPTVRSEIVDVLRRYGVAAVPGLSRAVADTNQEVRQRALDALKGLGVQTREDDPPQPNENTAANAGGSAPVSLRAP